MAIDHNALVAAIDEAREHSYGTDETSSLAKRRAKAIEYYLGLNTNPAPEGRSQVVDRSVYETISVKLPSLVKIFAGSSDEVVRATPTGPSDEEGADQQTAVLNYVVTQQNQWEQIASDWITDALLCPNGYAMAYWDESKTVIREKYEGQSEDQLAAIMQDTGVEVVEHDEYEDEQSTLEAQQAYEQQIGQWQQMAMQAAQQGQEPPPPPQPPGPVVLHDIVIERVDNEGKVCIKVIPPEHCYTSLDTPDWTLRDCPYFEYRQEKTIADLRAMGLDVPDDISDDEDETEEDHARDRFGEDRTEAGKAAMRRVWARMVWIRATLEGKEARLYYAILVGRTVLFCEQTTRIPVASMVSQPLPHRHPGLSEAETVFDIQDIKTAVTRGGLDNLYLANNGRYGVSSKVNLADMLDSRPGGVVRMTDPDAIPGEGHIMPLVHPFAFDQIVGSLEYFDQGRQNRSGASRYFSGTDAGAINKTASGTMALQNMASMRIEHQARMMAPAVEDLFSAVQEILARHKNKPMTIKLREQWVTVDPQAWRTKRDMRISVGVGAGNKDSMMAQLGQTLMAQMQLGPMGLAGPQQLYATVTEMSKLAGFANTKKFWIDPATVPPQQPQPPIEVILEQMKQQFEANQAEMDRRLDASKTQADNETKEYVAEIQTETQKIIAAVKLWAEQFQQSMQAQLDERRAAEEGMRKDLEFVAKQADRQPVSVNVGRSKEEEKAELSQMAESFSKQMADLAARIEGGRTVRVERIRGKDGKLAGGRVVRADGTTQDIQFQ